MPQKIITAQMLSTGGEGVIAIRTM